MNKSNNNQVAPSARQQRPAAAAQPRAQRRQSQQAPRKANPQRALIPRAPRPALSGDQVGAVVRTRLTKLGMSDVRSHRVAWVAGTIYVGNGTNGTADSVYFQSASGLWIVKGFVAGSSSGQFPILAADSDLGATYVSDVEKHYARKVVKRMWLHIDSLQPSTSNNMMAVIGVSRGPGAADASIPITPATAAITANTTINVSSMKDAFVVDSWEHRTIEITDKIAGGSGPRQNEFEIEGAPGGGNFYTTTATASTYDVNGIAPACIAVAGNSTTAALRGTSTHLVTIEQEIDLLDYVGGMSVAHPES